MKKRWIILICILLIGGCVLMGIFALQGKKFSNDTLLSCTVSTGGGMDGGSRTIQLTRSDDGAALAFSEKATHADRLRTTTYQVRAEALSQVQKIVEDYHLYAASKRPYSKMRVLDGETTTISFRYQTGSFSVSGEQVLTKKMTAGFRMVIDYLQAFAGGDGVETIEPQTATLYLKSGYTLQFRVEDAFDGRLGAVLGEEQEVAAFETCGIVLSAGKAPKLSGAVPETDAAAGTIVYDKQSDRVILLYADKTFDRPVYCLARLDGDVASAGPLIAEMQGAYQLYLNE